MTSGNVDCCKEGVKMKSVKFMKLICAFCAVGGVFFSVPAEAGGTHWSINIGVPVIAAPPPVAVYSNPVVPVATVVSPAPVMIHPHVVPRPVAVHHPVPPWKGPRYHGNRYRHRGHR